MLIPVDGRLSTQTRRRALGIPDVHNIELEGLSSVAREPAGPVWGHSQRGTSLICGV
jgi:hypothetical protein